MVSTGNNRKLRASVILVSYNSQADLARCLPSLQPSLTHQDEVIVVDNDSFDGSADWLEKAYPKVRLIRSSDNLGFGGGNNLGAKHAKGEYLVFINPDTMVEHGWLEALILALETQPEAGMGTSKILLRGKPDLINTCGNDIHITGLTLCRGMGHSKEGFSTQSPVAAVSGAAFIIRRSLFEKIEGFDADFFLYMEDTDLSWRAQLAGEVCIFVPQSIIWHEYMLTIGPKKVYYQERNRYLMLLKSLRWSTLFLLMPVLILAELITWGFVWIYDRRNLMNKLQAYTWILQNWDKIMKKRQQVQAFRKISDHQLLARTTFLLGFEQVGEKNFSRLANILFTPLFWILRKLTLILVRW